MKKTAKLALITLGVLLAASLLVGTVAAGHIEVDPHSGTIIKGDTPSSQTYYLTAIDFDWAWYLHQHGYIEAQLTIDSSNTKVYEGKTIGVMMSLDSYGRINTIKVPVGGSDGKITGVGETELTFTLISFASLPRISGTAKLDVNLPRYTVTFDVQDHGTAPQEQSIESGKTVSRPDDPSAPGYAFGGWYKEKECINPWNFETDTVFCNMTLYAKWSLAWTIDPIPEQTWTGLEITPKVRAHDGDKLLVEGVDYTLSYSGNIGPGTATVTLTGIGTYKGAMSVTFLIQKGLDKCTIAPIPDQVWTGSPVTPAVTVKDGEDLLIKNTDYTVSYSDNLGPGTAAAIVTGTGKYKGAQTVSFSIKKGIDKCTIDSIPDQTWTGFEISPDVKVHDDDKLLVKDTDYTVSYSNNIDPGTATVTVKGIGIYSGVQTASFLIQKELDKCTIDPIRTRAWTGSPVTPKVTVRDGETVLVKDIDYTVSYSDNIDSGTAKVMVEGKNRYTGSKQTTFEIIDPETSHEVNFEYRGEAPCDILPEHWAVKFEEKVALPVGEDIKFSGYDFKGWSSEDLEPEWWDIEGETFTMPDHDVTIIGTWSRMTKFDDAVEVYVIEEESIAYINGGIDTNKDVKAYIFAASNIDENPHPSYLAAYALPGTTVPEPSAAPPYTDFRIIGRFNFQAELKTEQNASEGHSQLDIYVEPAEDMVKENIYLLQYNASSGTWSDPIKPLAGYPKVYSGDVYEYMFTIDHYNTPFALVYEKPVSKKSSSSSQGSSYWATETPTPTPTPTPTATPTPVETPSVKPIATETPAASPAPFAGILAGLGAAAAVFGLRRR